MSSWEQALVIILAVTLALFLLVAIVAIIKIIQIINHIKRITAKAEAVVDKAESVATFFQNVSAPTALIRLMSNIVDSFRDHKAAQTARGHHEKKH